MIFFEDDETRFCRYCNERIKAGSDVVEYEGDDYCSVDCIVDHEWEYSEMEYDEYRDYVESKIEKKHLNTGFE